MATQHDTEAAEGSFPLPRRQRKPDLLGEGVRVRLTSGERATLQARAAAAGQTLSEYARRLLTGPAAAPSSAPTPKVPPHVDLVVQLRRLGQNHNQLLHRVNAELMIEPGELPASLAALDAQLKRIERLIFAVVDA